MSLDFIQACDTNMYLQNAPDRKEDVGDVEVINMCLKTKDMKIVNTNPKILGPVNLLGTN